MQIKHCAPLGFVWTKFGVEAGESVAEIIARKEQERILNGGIFLWGVGNNVGPSISALVSGRSPEVIFSPISTPPRQVDESPAEIFAWTAAETFQGEPFEIPRGSFVTSRGGPKKRFHYALVCYSERPLEIQDDSGTVYAGSLKNLVSGRQVGSSQVTSVVEADLQNCAGRKYPIAMRISLMAPYFVRLSHPVAVPHYHFHQSGEFAMDRFQCSVHDARQNQSRPPCSGKDLRSFRSPGHLPDKTPAPK